MANKMVNDAETGTIIKNLLAEYPEEVKALVADHEGAISSKLARVWSKELKGEIITSSTSDVTQSSLELQNSPKAGEKMKIVKWTILKSSLPKLKRLYSNLQKFKNRLKILKQ